VPRAILILGTVLATLVSYTMSGCGSLSMVWEAGRSVLCVAGLAGTWGSVKWWSDLELHKVE
jgi:hypothetical protein